MTHLKSEDDVFKERFEPRMLIADAQAQAAELDWLPAALSNCGPGQWESCAYVHYVSGNAPNQRDSQWQFEKNIVINHKVFGMLVIDILRGDRIGGIEFVDRIEC